MQCANLSLANFRNYIRLELDLAGDSLVFVGNNAQGKSNLLEAIYCLATTKSFRAGSDRELINWDVASDDVAFAKIGAVISRNTGSVRLDLSISSSDQRAGGALAGPVGKRFRVNGLPRRAFDVIGQVNVVHFAPQDVDLIVGSPSIRRRYLDITIAQVDTRYVRTLAHYGKVLIQRNHLLRRIRDRETRRDQLPFWDDELVNAGAYIVMRRMETVTELAHFAHESHRDLALQQELLEISYRGTVASDVCSVSVDDRLAAIAESFRSALAISMERDIASGMTLIGPHRDDLAFSIDGHDCATFGSRGQQRTVALALKIAEGSFIHSATGEWPILLLDDVMSELDRARRERVLASVMPGQQVLLTTTDIESVEKSFIDRARVYEISQGTVRATRSLTNSPAPT